MANILDNTIIHKLPKAIGVYILKDKNGEIIYIGKSFNIRERVKTHLTNKTWSAAPHLANPLRAYTNQVDCIITENEPEALIKESELIKKHKPKYNIMLRDDKQYFYVGFIAQDKKTKNNNLEKAPYLVITHQPPKTKNPAPKTYIGPFTDGKSLKLVLKYLRKVFPYYTKPHGILPCAYCHIDLCPGPDPDLGEYKKNIAKIKHVLQAKKPRVLSSLKKEMKKHSDNTEYEKAHRVRRQIQALENIFSHANVGFMVESAGYQNLAEDTPKGGLTPLWSLNILDSAEDISIEAYDISNIQGREPVASMVRFEKGKPDKKMYRKFKIRLPESPDDFAMMEEVVRRRLAHPEWQYPDLFLIDGGKGQLSAALKAAASSS